MFALPFAPPFAPPIPPPALPPYIAPFGPPRQPFGRGLRQHRSLGSPLKRIGGNEHLYIESPMTNSIWPIRQRKLARHMPGLFQKMRESGNRIMNPLKLVPCNTQQDMDEDPIVLDLLMNGIGQPYVGSLFRFPSPTGGLDINDYFLQLYIAGTQAISAPLVQTILNIFQRLSAILRNDSACGFGDDIYKVIVEWAVKFMPIIGPIPAAIYMLIDALYTMTNKDEATLRILLGKVPAQYQLPLVGEAYQRTMTEQSFLSNNIMEVYQGLPLSYPI
ncbi:hypothetical protein ONS95_014564 [Cadophora gregata]|uniref:uncharacterized protein n=1 Tax=Cadophora gregata TaxID=51156 RepID=UPI0026DB58DC|nr:uncharacterized protein ONS95_014564 [Cadophora gregata]KAK0112837.1 hypothetical protein ONS95_014564 [Cadophora gregata]